MAATQHMESFLREVPNAYAGIAFQAPASRASH